MLNSITKKNWIQIEIRILYLPKKNLLKKEVNSQILKEKFELISILNNIKQVTSDQQIVGFINPHLGLNSVYTPDNSKKLYISGLSRDFKFKSNKIKNQEVYEYFINFLENEPSSKKIKNRAISGYSPIDYLKDKFLLAELVREIHEHFYIPFEESKGYIGYNKLEEPILCSINGVLKMTQRVVDRIKLMNHDPELEKACFGDSFVDYIKQWRKKSKDKMITKWLNDVDKLVKDEK